MQKPWIRALIIDDEHDARQKLKGLLSKYCPQVLVTGEADSVDSGLVAIDDHEPELVFLDVLMPPKTGFDLLRTYAGLPFHVIFITSYDKFAVEAFRFSATDYLLKPVSPQLLREAVEKVTDGPPAPTIKKNIEVLLNWEQTQAFGTQSLVVPHHDGFEVVQLREIILCRGDGYCTHIHLTGGRNLLSTRNLKHFDELLTNRNFLRVHQSFLINLFHVKSYNSPSSQIHLTDCLVAGLGNAYRNRFMELFKGIS
jgi:two-component system LytT family response regulator